MVAVKKGAKAKKGASEPALVDLTAAEVRALAKPRAGFEEYVELLLGVRERFGDELASANVNTAKVRANIAAVAKLDASIAVTRKQLEMLEETRLLLASQAWTDLLAIYNVAKAVAKSDAKVAKAIEPFVTFMRTGTKKKGDKKG